MATMAMSRTMAGSASSRSRLILMATTTAVLVLALNLLSAVAADSLFARQHRQLATGANVTTEEYSEAILNARPVNASQSLDLIARLPLMRYEFKYDTIVGRTQLGPMAPALRALDPDGVQVVAQRVVSLPSDRQRRVALQNFHVVDKDALFMHNVAASQELIAADRRHDARWRDLQQRVSAHDAQLEQLAAHLAQEASAQLVEKRLIAENERAAAEFAIEEARVRGEEERRTLAESTQHALALEQEKHAREEQRLADEDALRRQQNEVLVALQEASHVRLELTRRETEAVLKEKQLAADRERMLLERNTTLEKAQIDVAGRIQQQRANQDIEMAQLAHRLEADRVRVLQALQATFDNLGQGVRVLLTDRDKLVAGVGGLVALAAGIYVAREGVRITGKLVEQRLGKPSLVRETSRTSGLVGWARAVGARVGSGSTRLWRWLLGRPEASAAAGARARLADVVLREALETRVHEIARSVRNAVVHGAPFRHLLLYGPPGTGKTMVAKRLAQSSGLDYAILSGGDVGPLGAEAVTELHALFRWARASPRGVLVFIDEAEAFLGCRATRKTHMSEPMRNALNALLYHTGSPSRHFLLVIATNRPEDLDGAVTDRIDDALHFDLPEQSERVRLLEMYFTEYVGAMPHERVVAGVAPSTLGKPGGKTGGKQPAKLKRKESEKQVSVVGTERGDGGGGGGGVGGGGLVDEMQQYGALTQGMSGREIAKMMLYLQSIVYAQDDVTVTRALIRRVVHEKVEEHKRKLELRTYNEQ